MSWSFSYSLQTFIAITSSLSQCHRYKRFTHKVVHFGLFHSQKTKKINVSITQICSLSRNINMLFLCQQMLISWSTTRWCVHIPNKNSNSSYITYGYGCRNCPNLKITQTQCISFTVQTILFDSTFLLPVGLIHILLCKLI